VILAAPVVWTGLELARGHLLTGFTMASLGHTQYRWLQLIQISDLAGAYGVSFVVMLGASCLARIIPRHGRRPALWPLVPLGAMLAAVLAYGEWRMAVPPPVPQARIALIQGSIDIQLKTDDNMRPYIFSHYMDLSREAVRRSSEQGRKPDLIVWPETMFRDTLLAHDENAQPPDGWEHSREDFLRVLAREEVKSRSGMAAVAAELDTALLLGVDTVSFGRDGPEVFNSAAHVSRSGELLGRYDKIHLVMFGEYVPFARCFPWLQRLTPLPNSLSAGKDPQALDVGPLRIAPSICFETVLPHVIRRQVNMLAGEQREPHVLVNLTNDGWFWGSSELDMHLICGVFRAVECRKPLLIAANTGFSAWIEADGRIRARGPRRDTGTILADVGPDPRRSLYLRYGDWFAGGCLVGCLLLGAAGFRDWRRRPADKRSEKPGRRK
jgi:apolipoprotein N-acyltransferase